MEPMLKPQVRPQRAHTHAIVRKLLARNVSLPKQTLCGVFGTGPLVRKSATLADFWFLQKLKAQADLAMLAHLVGLGFLRPESAANSQSFKLTEKGRSIVEMA